MGKLSPIAFVLLWIFERTLRICSAMKFDPEQEKKVVFAGDRKSYTTDEKKTKRWSIAI